MPKKGPSRDFLQLSTSGLRWWKAELLVSRPDLMRMMTAGQYEREVDLKYAVPSNGDLPLTHFRGMKYPSIPIRRGAAYDVEKMVESARRHRDPTVAPHGFFREMHYQHSGNAVRFLQQHGPLYWSQGNLDVTDWVHLDHLWAHQIRFRLICDLWEALGRGTEAITAAWKQIREHMDEARLPDGSGLGRIVDTIASEKTGLKLYAITALMPWAVEPGEHVPQRLPAALENRPWEASMQFSSKDDRATMERKLAIALIQDELSKHPLSVVWAVEEMDRQVCFAPVRHANSLLALIWELFSAETRSALPWRYCRQCGKPFYPMRRDTECCTTEEQSLWSKREWARKTRQKKDGKQ
jgi:hypothetical protein